MYCTVCIVFFIRLHYLKSIFLILFFQKEMIKIKLKNKSNYNLANCITIDLRIPEPFIEVTLCVKFPLKITSIFD